MVIAIFFAAFQEVPLRPGAHLLLGPEEDLLSFRSIGLQGCWRIGLRNLG